MKRDYAIMLICNQLNFINDKWQGAMKFEDFSEKEKSHADVILTTLEEAGIVEIKESMNE